MDQPQSQIAVWEQRITALQNAAPRKATVVKYALGAGAVALFAPVAISGLVGAVALAAFGVVVLTAVHAAPVLSRYLVNRKTELLIAEANRHLQACKAEASRNPVETLELESKQKHEELRDFAQSITDFDTEVQNLRDTVQDEGLRSPAAKRKGEEVLAAMERKLAYRRKSYSRAAENLKLFDEVVEEARAMWRVAQAAQRADAASGESGQDFMRKIMQETALGSVSTSVNAALAGLRTSMMKAEVTEDDIIAIEHSPSPTLAETLPTEAVVVTVKPIGGTVPPRPMPPSPLPPKLHS